MPPSRCRRCASSSPAGPAPTMPTCVRMVLPPPPSSRYPPPSATLQLQEYLLGQPEAVIGRRHAAVDCRLQQHLLDLLPGQPVVEGGLDVQLELVPVAE